MKKDSIANLPKLEPDEIDYLQIVRADLVIDGTSSLCPFNGDLFVSKCTVCSEYFPGRGYSCPCHSNLTKKYLIKRLTEIIDYHTKGRKNNGNFTRKN